MSGINYQNVRSLCGTLSGTTQPALHTMRFDLTAGKLAHDCRCLMPYLPSFLIGCNYCVASCKAGSKNRQLGL